MAKTEKVWILKVGSGDDGDESRVESVHATEAGAQQAAKESCYPDYRRSITEYPIED